MRQPPLYAVLLVCCFDLIGCRRVAPDGPIDSMTLYSLDGNFTPGYDKPHKGEAFYDYPVLGKAEIASPDDRRAILAAVLRGFEENRGTEAKCFWPHHGIRFVQDSKRVEYLICFQCYQAYRYSDGKALKQLTSRSPAKVLDAHLKKAGVQTQHE